MKNYQADPKINFISSDDEKAKESLSVLKKKYKHYKLKDANLIVVLGGDGTILSSLHKNYMKKIPIYGMNRGNIGFLMNNYSIDNLEKRLKKSIPTKLFPLKIKTFSKEGDETELLAFNEVSLIRDSHQSAKIKIDVNGVTKIEELQCDGCLISTPAGSSAYNLSLRGPVVPIGAKILALTPISPFRPRRWKGALLPNNAKITLTSKEIKKRPLRAEADFFEIKDIHKIEVELHTKIFAEILFDKGHDLEERIINEQFNH